MQKNLNLYSIIFHLDYQNFEELRKKGKKRKKKLGKISWNFETFQISDSIPVKNNKKNEQPVSNSTQLRLLKKKKNPRDKFI